MRALLDVFLIVLQLFVYALIIQAILSWLISFNVVNLGNRFVASIWQALQAVTEPVLRPIRNFLPRTGGIDFTPLVAILIVILIQRFIGYYIYPVVP